MRRYYYFLALAILLLCNCTQEKLAPFNPKNYLSQFQTEKSQFFDLDTLYFKEIIGKHGTRINFNRELFDINDTVPIQLELIELYNFKEILYRNIQTLTTDNKLLETSGVLKIKFTSRGKEIKLKKGEKLIIYPPKEKLRNNDIFLSVADSIGNIKWKLTDQSYTRIETYLSGGITKLEIIPTDSLPNYLQYINQKKSTLNKLVNSKINKRMFVLTQTNNDWINIDRFVNTTSKINFQIKDHKKEFSGYHFYFNYKGLDSFLYESRLNDDLLFYEIPLEGKVNMVIIGEKNNEIFYDTIELSSKLNETDIQLNMKKTTEEKLKRLFD